MEEGREMERRGTAEVGMGACVKSPERLQEERVSGREFVSRFRAAGSSRSESRRRPGGLWRGAAGQ